MTDAFVLEAECSTVFFDNELTYMVSDEEMDFDDVVALSGRPGKSFHRIKTGTATTEQLQQLEELGNAIIAAPDYGSSVSDLSDIEFEQMLDLTLEEFLTEDVSSSCSSTRIDIELEWDNDTPIQPSTSNSMNFQRGSVQQKININGEEYTLDLNIINPYRQVINHGGYYGDGLNAIVVFSACYLPNRNMSNYHNIMDNLFLYIVYMLDLIVADKYVIIFLNGGCNRRNLPNFWWLRKCYKMINHRLHKNLQHLLVVHASLYIKFLVAFFRPFVSSKFNKKLKLVPTLYNLADIVEVDGISFPEVVLQHDLCMQVKK